MGLCGARRGRQGWSRVLEAGGGMGQGQALGLPRGGWGQGQPQRGTYEQLGGPATQGQPHPGIRDTEEGTLPSLPIRMAVDTGNGREQ